MELENVYINIDNVVNVQEQPTTQIQNLSDFINNNNQQIDFNLENEVEHTLPIINYTHQQLINHKQ